jgi:hypothetical protein
LNALPARLAAAVLTLCLATEAHAGKPGAPPAETPWARSQGNRAGLEFDLLNVSAVGANEGRLTYESSTSTGMVMAVVGQIRLMKWLYLDAELPVAIGIRRTKAVPLPPFTTLPNDVSPDETRTGFFLGNPTIGVHHVGDLSADFALWGGLSVSVPVMGVDGDGQELALQNNFVARARFDTHRVLAEYLVLRARGGAELRLLPNLLYRGDLGLLLALSTGDRAQQTYLEQSNEIEVRTGFGLGGGLRVQEAFLFTLTDKFQAAVEPFVSYEATGVGLYGRVGYLVALDPDLGFGLSSGKIATLRVALGARF